MHKIERDTAVEYLRATARDKGLGELSDAELQEIEARGVDLTDAEALLLVGLAMELTPDLHAKLQKAAEPQP